MDSPTILATTSTGNIPGSPWVLYLLECENGSYYAGITTDLERRFAEHVFGIGARYTRANPPQRVIAAKSFPDRGSALRAEAALKNFRGRKSLRTSRRDAMTASPNLRSIPNIPLSDGSTMPRLGIGTWRMGETRGERKQEILALRHAMARGVTLFDTAEMYGDGAAEEVLGEALRDAGGERDARYIVSKVYPWNASRSGTIDACEQSLTRLGIDCLDLYLLHWRGEHPLADTVAAFEKLKRDGKIKRWGVSNFDSDDIAELAQLEHGRHCVVNQVYYNLGKRWPEATLLQEMQKLQMATMAYSPLDQGKLARHRVVQAVAAEIGATAVQVALAWLLARPGVIAIPKSSRIEGIDEIVGSTGILLNADQLAALQRAFPRPHAEAKMQTT